MTCSQAVHSAGTDKLWVLVLVLLLVFWCWLVNPFPPVGVSPSFRLARSSRRRFPVVSIGSFFSRPGTLRRPPLPRHPPVRPPPSRRGRCPQQVTCLFPPGLRTPSVENCRRVQGYRSEMCTAIPAAKYRANRVLSHARPGEMHPEKSWRQARGVGKCTSGGGGGGTQRLPAFVCLNIAHASRPGGAQQ